MIKYVFRRTVDARIGSVGKSELRTEARIRLNVRSPPTQWQIKTFGLDVLWFHGIVAPDGQIWMQHHVIAQHVVGKLSVKHEVDGFRQSLVHEAFMVQLKAPTETGREGEGWPPEDAHGGDRDNLQFIRPQRRLHEGLHVDEPLEAADDHGTQERSDEDEDELLHRR